MSSGAMYSASTKLKFLGGQVQYSYMSSVCSNCLITVFQFYCPWESKIWLLFIFSTNLALQCLTSNEG